MAALLRRLDRLVFLACKWGVVGGLAALFLLLGANVLTRTFPFVSIAGYDEIVELIFAWMTFLGAVALWREGALYRVGLVIDTVPTALRRLLQAAILLLMLAMALVLTWKGSEFVLYSGETTPFLRLDKAYWYAAVPVCGALMTLYSLVALVRAVLGRDQPSDTIADHLG